jgi:hypothetical protein
VIFNYSAFQGSCLSSCLSPVQFHAFRRPSGSETKARKTPGSRYRGDMTAEAILQKSVRYDRAGKPLEVVIPYEEF